MAAEGRNQEGSNHRGLQGHGDVEGGERGANGQGKRLQKQACGLRLQSPRGKLRNSPKVAWQRVQRRAVEAGGSGKFSKLRGDPIPEGKG